MSIIRVYLDLNVVADLSSDPKIPVNLHLLIYLIWLKKNRDIEVVYSDTHIHELGFTGYKSKMECHVRKHRILNDLNMLKILTNSRRIYKKIDSDTLEVDTRCPLKLFETIDSTPLFLMMKKLMNTPPNFAQKQVRELIGLGPKVLNNLKNAEEARSKINSVLRDLPRAYNSLNDGQKCEVRSGYVSNGQYLKKGYDEIIELLKENLEKELDYADISEEHKTTIRDGIVNLEAKSSQWQIEDLDTTNINLPAEGWDFEKINSTVDAILKDNNFHMNKSFFEKYLLNYLGFESKPLKFGISSDYFDIQHSEYLEGVTFFITNEDENFKKRFSQYASRIVGKEEFVNIIKDRLGVVINISSDTSVES